MLDPYGIEFTYEVKSMMMGKKGLEAIEIMLKHYNLEIDSAEFYQNREEILDELFQECDLMPGALRLVKHLKKHQIPMAIATSSHKRHFELKTLRHRGLFEEMFQAVITGDEVVHSKPNPEIFVKAAETLAGGIDYNPAHFLVRIFSINKNYVGMYQVPILHSSDIRGLSSTKLHNIANFEAFR